MYQAIRQLNCKRIANYVACWFDFMLSRATGKVQIRHKPVFISAEPANYCNLRCPECPVGMGEIPQKAAQMDLELYRKLIDELAPTLHTVNLYFQGEPLFARNFCDMVRYAKQHKIYTITSTNGQLLTDEIAKQLVQSGLDKIIISVDGATQTSYEAYRVNGDLQTVINGIRSLAFWKRELHSRTPFIEAQCLRLRSNEHEWDTLKRQYKAWGGNRLVFKTAQFYNYENGKALMPESRYSRYAKQKDGKYALKYKQPNHCLRLWSGAVVDAHGNVLPCCFDKQARYAFGNMATASFDACWHSEAAYRFRKKVLQNRSRIDICTNCTSR